MSVFPDHFQLDLSAVAAPDAVVEVGNARFTVLTDRLVRLEYDSERRFEDRPTQAIWYREQPVPAFTVRSEVNFLEIETVALVLRYEHQDNQPFNAENLSIYVKAADTTWHPGVVDTQNLKGTTRTLDYTNGYKPLEPGLISRSGWGLLDDSTSFALNPAGMLEPRSGAGFDWYFFAYGNDYRACLSDYCQVSGHIPMIPRWILGNWWSRYWAYTQQELTQLVNDFESHDIPLSVCIIDMDWHVTNTGNKSTGWTGYTWNKELFPDPEGFIDFLHEKGLKTAMNLHPAEGVHPHESMYPEMARRMGIDPASQQPVEFDITDPEFVRAYFEVLHHPYEEMGVDFWWIDWQQGQKSKIEGLDPLWLINHLHFQDLGRNPNRRPFIFSRWGREGHQRYPIGFSGDSYMTWDTLRFEPYMTATAANVAYGWWSHDIGGHTSGVGDSELFTRWVQFGVFSPIMRIHSTKGAFYDQRPWMFEDAEVNQVLRDTLQLRHALIPYIYTMAWRAHRDSLPLMLPMYYEYPDVEAAYHCPQQYWFGSEMIAAPFVDPIDSGTSFSRQVVWLPEGDWYHVFTGQHYQGGRWHAIYGTLRDIPLFARAGAIVPMGPKVGWGGLDNPNELHLHVFAGADGTFTLYEDDGESRNYQQDQFCETRIVQSWDDNQLEVSIAAPEGDTNLLPETRLVTLHLHGIGPNAQISVEIAGTAINTVEQHYDDSTETLVAGPFVLPSTASMQLTAQASGLLSRRDRKRETILRLLRAFKLNSGVRNQLFDKLDAVMDNPELIAAYALSMTESQMRALMEILYEAGIHHVMETDVPTRLILWNNNNDPAIRYRYGTLYLHFGMVQSAHHEHGELPKYATLTPEIKSWQHGALNQHVRRTQWQLQVDYHQHAIITESYRETSP